MNTKPPGPTEITPKTALELVGLGLATMIDVRQPYELEYSKCMRCVENIPLLHFKQTLGHALTREEQEIIDLDQPGALDITAFIAAINRHQIRNDTILLCLCRSGKRSRYAVQLLRSINYKRCFSIAGGIQAIVNVCPCHDSPAFTFNKSNYNSAEEDLIESAFHVSGSGLRSIPVPGEDHEHKTVTCRSGRCAGRILGKGC